MKYRQLSLGEIAAHLGAEVEGDPTVVIRRAQRLEDASPGDITFADNPRYAPQIGATRASAVILDSSTPAPGKTVLRVTGDPRLAFARTLTLLLEAERRSAGVRPGAYPGLFTRGVA